MQKKLLKFTLIIFITVLFILSINVRATEDEINANSDILVGSDSESNTTQNLSNEDSDEETELENEEDLSDETNENVVDEEIERYR